MKKSFYTRILIVMLSSFITSFSLAQTPWNIEGNRGTDTSYIGTNNYKDLKFKTDSITRMTISKDGDASIEKNLSVPNGILTTDSISGVSGNDVNILNNLNIAGTVSADSITSNSGDLKLNSNLNMPDSWIHADSLRVRSIHVGDSSMIITTNTPAGIGNFMLTNINSPISFGRSGLPNPCIGPLSLSSFPGVTIGTATGTYMLHIHNQYGACQNNPGSYAHFTVNATAIGGFNTSQTVNDGFLVGIGDDGTANLLQRENLPIHSLTNNSRRMTIEANGNVGIGDYSTFVPNYLLHLHNNTNNQDVWQQYTTANSGTANNDGFKIGINYVPGGTPRTDVEFIQYETSDMNFYTDFNNGMGNLPRMTVMGHNNIPNWGNNIGYVGIGNTQPLSMLHIGNMNCYNGGLCAGIGSAATAGYRQWMKTGVFMCGVDGVASSDNMYVGLMNVDSLDDRDDAVIAWGDNIGAGVGATNGPDNLRFIFTEYCLEAGHDNTASSMNGLEGMRLMPMIDATTNAFVSLNAGIGDYTTNNPVIPPMRRLEVLDGGLGLPQLRLTNNQGANVSLGTYTDFDTRNNGDLNITPVNNGAGGIGYGDYRRVGIDYPTIGVGYNPNLAFDVNGQTNLKTVNHDPNDTMSRVLVWVPSVWGGPGDGRVMWRDANTIGNAGTLTGAQNAASIVGGNTVEWGLNPLLHDTEVPMLNGAGGLNNEWSVYYSGQSTMVNASNPVDIGIGYAFGTPLVGKIDVENVTFSGIGFNNINLTAGNFHNTGTYDVAYPIATAAFAGFYTGVTGTCDIANPNYAPTANVGGYFTGSDTRYNFGVIGIGENTSIPVWSLNCGVEGIGRYAYRTRGVVGNANNNYDGIGVQGFSTASTGLAVGVHGFANGSATLTSSTNGVVGGAQGSLPGNNYGVVGGVYNAGDWAGYFSGDVLSTTGVYATSDSIFKNDILDINPDSALSIISQLKPKTYYFDTTSYPLFTFPSRLQYGLIAEDVDNVIPNLVKNTIQPKTIDSSGNVIDSTRLHFKSLNYVGLIPILVGAIKQIDSTLTARPKDACNAT